MSTRGNLSEGIRVAMRAVKAAYKNTAGKDRDEQMRNSARLFYEALRIIEIAVDKRTPRGHKLNMLSGIMATAYSLKNNPCADCEKSKAFDKIMLERQNAKIYDENGPEYPCDNCTEKLPPEEL